MKYRSIGIFTILIASLAAVPQASRELGALRDSASALLRAELGNAFLSLQDRADRSVENRETPKTSAESPEPCEKSDVALATDRNNRSKERRLENGVRKFDIELGKMLTDPAHVELSRMITDPTFHPGQKQAEKSIEPSFLFADLRRGVPIVELAQLSNDVVSTFPVEAVNSRSRVATLDEPDRRRASRAISRSDRESEAAAYEISIDAGEARQEVRRVREETSREARARGTAKGFNSPKLIEGVFKFLKVEQRNAFGPAAPAPPPTAKDLSCDETLKMFEGEEETR